MNTVKQSIMLSEYKILNLMERNWWIFEQKKSLVASAR